MTILEITLSGILIAIIIAYIFTVYNLKKQKKPPVKKLTLAENFFVLQQVIDIIKPKYYDNLIKIQKRFSILQTDGTTAPPNNSIAEYVAFKRKIQTAWSAQVVRGLSVEVRSDFLNYFSTEGFIKYILTELEKES